MKKIKSNLLTLLFFVIIFLFLMIYTFMNEFSCTDEIWNFQSIYKMCQGGLIYKDNNVIITPLFFLIGNILFHLFGANLNVFRAYGIAIYFVKFILIFLIFTKFKSRKNLSALYTLLWITLEYGYLPNGANYNQLAILLALLGILLYITHYSKKSYHFLQGFLIFLTFFTKQTFGIYYAFGIVLFELMDNGLSKNFFRNQLQKLITFLPCSIICLAIMYIQGNLFDFINLCFGSILEFGSSNHSFSWYNLKYIFAIAFIVAFSIYVIKSKNVSNDKKMNAKFLLCLAIGLSFNMLPLMNEYHINMALLFYFILFIYILDQLLINEVFSSTSHKRLSIVIMICIFVTLYLKLGYLYFSNYKNLEHFNQNHPFYNSAISADEKEKIENMTNYITSKKSEGIRVIILSYEAAQYMVPLGINNDEFDLAFSGNLGYRGIENIIETISTMQNTEFLIFTDEEDCFYQESKEIREYIMNHLQKNGEFLKYSIYINN